MNTYFHSVLPYTYPCTIIISQPNISLSIFYHCFINILVMCILTIRMIDKKCIPSLVVCAETVVPLLAPAAYVPVVVVEREPVVDLLGSAIVCVDSANRI